MPLPLDADTISHGIQLSVAPVFLLSAGAGMIGAVANRLARIIDRARTLESSIRDQLDEAHLGYAYQELAELRNRGLLANTSIALLTLCGVLIGMTIVVLFLGETIDFQMLKTAVYSFIAGLVCFVFALICFLAETLIATRILNFGRKQKRSQKQA